MTNICNDDYNEDGDYIPDRVTADDDDHNVDAHSGDQNLSLSDQFLKERIWFCIKSGFTRNNCSTGMNSYF